MPPKKEIATTIRMFKPISPTPGITRETAALGVLEVEPPFPPEFEPPELEVPDGPPAESILVEQVELREDGVASIACFLKSQASAASF